MNAPDYQSFNEIVRMHDLNGQVQYLSRCLRAPNRKPIEGYPDLSEGLRVMNDRGDYHDWYVHIEDVPELVARFRTYIASRQF